MFGFVVFLWDINPSGLFNAKSCLDIYHGGARHVMVITASNGFGDQRSNLLTSLFACHIVLICA